MTMLSLLPIGLGVALCAHGDLEFTWFGFIVIVISCFLAALKGVTTNIMLVGSKPVHPMHLLYLLCPPAMIQMIILSYFAGEVQDLQFKYEMFLVPVSLCIIFGTGIMAFLLNWTNFQASKETSALTVSVASCAKEVITIGLSFLIFNTVLTSTNACGIVLSILGSLLYNYNARTGTENKDKSNKEPTATNSSSEMGFRSLSLGKTTKELIFNIFR